MRRAGIGSRAALLFCGFVACAARPAFADGTSPAASPETISDFLIQNVCLDASRAVISAVSPIDGNPRCVVERDLAAGERLPYHKHDHPAPGDRTAAPRGYQRQDSFAVDTLLFGRVIEHSFDFGDGAGRRFGVFDGAKGDGGNITLISPSGASFAATEDGGSGFQLFAGPDCHGPVSPAGLVNSWIIALLDPRGASAPHGQTVARLADLRPGRQETCPSRFDAAFTRWYVRPVRYRAAEGQGVPVTLTTLISEHYGGESPEGADHVERFYFTRELGSTRWERWQNPSRSRGSSAVAAARCGAAEAPEGAAFVMLDCREWTLIEPPDDPAGDRPGFFLDAVRSRHLGGELFTGPRAR